jgi:sugar/nucleoside kinase (ribokinase family)
MKQNEMIKLSEKRLYLYPREKIETMRKYDIAAIGELNVDVIMNGIESEPEIGKEKFAQDMTVTLGSSTAIFAANAASLGSRVCFVGMIGRDSFGHLVRTSLEARGVDTSYLVEGDVPTGASICMSYGEDRAVLTYQGAMDVMGLEDMDLSVFDQAKHIHLSSIFMQSGILRDLERILDLAASKGVTVSLDTQWDPVEKWAFDYKRLLPKITIFMPNEKELQCLTGKADLESAISAVEPYLGCAMMLKCGSKGSILIKKDGSRTGLPAFLNRDVVDAIGAGDSCNSGFVSAFVKGLPLEECQRTGNLTGAVNTTAAGGTGAFTSLEDVKKVCRTRFGQELKL